MKIETIKERRKTITLKIIDAENAVLKVPRSLPESRVQEFLHSKQNWLERNAEKMKKNEAFSSGFQFDKFVYINAEKFIQTKDLALGFDRLSDVKKRALIKKCYLYYFENLVRVVKEISYATGLKYKEIKPTNSVRIWGSFNTAGLMKLNWKLVILPQRLVEYVIIHELCHGKHMNHSPKFWKEVEKFCPNYKQLKKELTSFGFLLKNNLI